MEHALTSVLDT